MADVTLKRIDELPGYMGQFLYAGKALGISAWGMNVLVLPANWDGYPDHDHATDGQEEAYVVIEGTAVLHAGKEQWVLTRGDLVRVGPTQKRKIVPGPTGVTILALGGIPGKAYTPGP